MEEKELLKCQYCEKQKPDVECRVDGYAQEVHESKGAMHIACDECDYQRTMDI